MVRFCEDNTPSNPSQVTFIIGNGFDLGITKKQIIQNGCPRMYWIKGD